MAHYFGTDGIRGRVDGEVMNVKWMCYLGSAIGRALLQQSKDTVLIGCDTRESSEKLEHALTLGLLASGAQVIKLGVVPTPAVAYLTRHLKAQAGIMISASHNPYQDNGIKVFNSHGFKLSEEQERIIEKYIDEARIVIQTERVKQVKPYQQEAQQQYIQYCQHLFAKPLQLQHLKLVIDAANGADAVIAPLLFERLGAEVIAIGCEPNGRNINENCGSLYPQRLQQSVQEHQANLGLALDGDGDRLLMVDERGELMDGDDVLAILAHYRLKPSGSLSGVVGTEMTNSGLEALLAQDGLDFIRAKVGDRFVLETCLEKKWTLGGEPSGHIINLNYATTGDGVVTALQVLQVMQQHQQPLSQLRQRLHKWPQRLENLYYDGDEDITQNETVRAKVTEWETKLSSHGRVSLRRSGTEPLIRIMVEAKSDSDVQDAIDDISACLMAVCAQVKRL